MKLYEFAPTRSIRARWTLQELGIDFEAVTVNLQRGDHRRPEFLRLNPAGKLPVLVDGDVVLNESVAIVLYLGKHPDSALLPTDLATRADLDRWLLFTVTELEQPLCASRATRRVPGATAGAVRCRSRVANQGDGGDCRIHLRGRRLSSATE
jgi:glutathione S-transferase